ncbi:MAG: DUF1444 family protein [Polyangiaceae bacterium]|nr:DUF1444 family protein [Myxococcales bacterium]MCB9584935.1 DUF1444 family protein [Polyangiaceae bacterium]MCB9607492.1 DUF1444 family protein [Polyangiaceae bacterium]
MGFFDRAKRAFFGGEGTTQAPPEAAKSPEHAFAEEVLGVLLADERVERAEIDPEAIFTIHVWLVGAADPSQLYLHNLRKDSLDWDPEQRRATIQSFVSSMTEHRDSDWESADGNLVPVLRTATFVGFVDAKLLARPFAGHVLEVLAIDRPNSLSLLTDGALEDWPITVNEAFTAARQHLGECSIDVPLEPWDASAAYPIWAVATGDSYESSRLAAPGWLAAQKDKVEGEPLCIVPHRDLLILTGDAHPDAVVRLFETALTEYRAASRSISPMVYCANGQGRILEYLPRADHAAYPLFERNAALFDLAEYEEQKQNLDHHFEEQGNDIFVASFNVMHKKDSGAYYSYAVWAEDVLTLLPFADYVAFMPRDDERHFLVPFDDVQELVGELMVEEPGMLPRRWRLESFPEGSVLEALREAATRP